MKLGRYIAFVFLVTSGCLAFATILDSAPAPAPFAECEAEYPQGITGTWRIDPSRTAQENTNSTGSRPPLDEMTTITITKDTYRVDVVHVGTIERSYKVIGGSANRFTLEMTDKAGAVSINDVELVPCGLVFEQLTSCQDAFCRNLIAEVTRSAYERAGQSISDEQIALLVEQSIQSQPEQPQAKQRVYYRRVVQKNPATLDVKQNP